VDENKTAPETSRREFLWRRHPEAEDYVTERLSAFTLALPAAASLEREMVARTGSHLFDWLDHLVLAAGDRPRGELRDLGFQQEDVPSAPGNEVWRHPNTMLPPILLCPGPSEPGTPLTAGIQVEDVAFFLMTHHLSAATSRVPSAAIEGTPAAPYRRALAWQQAGRALWVVERRGHPGFLPVEMPPDYPAQLLRAYERWATRPRLFDDERAGMEHTLALARSLCADVGTGTAAWIVLAAERAHWQTRNQAGQVQKARQDSLGLGWTNHDHHTFRSSRRNFDLLIQILETLGFRSRERFYAGAEAGWGAQVLEHPAWRPAPAGIFADVDLSPDEVAGDFAHEPLPERYSAADGEGGQDLGTVGLWCALHGESMLGAGLHHLAARLDFDRATEDLAGRGVEMMRPFSDFSYLRQAFTRGERWDVAPGRLARLAALAPGQIDEAQRQRFLEKGAVGSHLENIQRAEGFKGFNQQTVSDIIRRTDPRAEVGLPAA
jgi:hypothetical protein